MLLGAGAVGGDEQVLCPVEYWDAGDVGVPAVVADEEAAAAKRSVKGVGMGTEAVVPPRGMVALGQLHFVVLAAQTAPMVYEDGAVVHVVADALG